MKVCEVCKTEFSRKYGLSRKQWEGRRFCSSSCQKKGRRQTKRIWNKGLKCPQLSGANQHLWKGGVTKVNDQFRHSFEYRQWRTAVFQRDNYTCQSCKQYGGKLQADHELPFSLYPALRLEILNGRTLCIPCHKKTATYGEKVNSYDLILQVNQPSSFGKSFYQIH